MALRVALVLSGCGYLDGAEIRESVLSLLYLDKVGTQVHCFAPDIAQAHVMNHVEKVERTGENRNVLQEAARIARSDIKSLSELIASEFDALIIPGGFGVAKNLSGLAFKGADALVLPEFASIIEAFYAAQKPIGAICIAPAVVALALKNKNITLTVGDDVGTAAVITASGNIHQNAATNEVVIDTKNRIASCSAYMREDSISCVASGIEQCINAVMTMCAQSQERKAS